MQIRNSITYIYNLSTIHWKFCVDNGEFQKNWTMTYHKFLGYSNFSPVRDIEKFKKEVEIVVFFERSFGKFLSLRLGVVPIIWKKTKIPSFQCKFIHLKHRPIIRLLLLFSAKKYSQKDNHLRYFFQKNQKMQEIVSIIFFLHWCLSFCCCRKIFCIQNFSQFDEFVLDFALHRRLTTESINTCSSPEPWKILQAKLIKILQRTIKTPAKLCKSYEKT